jgi:hypothetical protein
MVYLDAKEGKKGWKNEVWAQNAADCRGNASTDEDTEGGWGSDAGVGPRLDNPQLISISQSGVFPNPCRQGNAQ